MGGKCVEFINLDQVRLDDLVTLHNDPQVLRHLPLAPHGFDRAKAKAWVQSKAQMWSTQGYGPWGIMIENRFAGWGGLQPEGQDADLALVLSPVFWGYGKCIYERFLAYAFNDLQLPSVTALLPLSRARIKGLERMGFMAEGRVQLDGAWFNRFRLHRPKMIECESTPAESRD